MGVKKRWLFVTLALILVFTLFPGCAGEKTASTPKPPPLPTPPPEISLEKAEELMGVPLLPKYLPAGYELQGCGVFSSGPHAHVGLCFSDEQITKQVETAQDSSSPTCKIVLDVRQLTEMPSPDFPEGEVEHWGGKVVDINGVKGHLSAGGHDLHWFLPGLHFFMYVVVDISEEEILKIARSIK